MQKKCKIHILPFKRKRTFIIIFEYISNKQKIENWTTISNSSLRETQYSKWYCTCARKNELLFVGTVMGVFIICWLPFFVINIVAGFCPSCIQVLTHLHLSNICTPLQSNFSVRARYISFYLPTILILSSQMSTII